MRAPDHGTSSAKNKNEIKEKPLLTAADGGSHLRNGHSIEKEDGMNNYSFTYQKPGSIIKKKGMTIPIPLPDTGWLLLNLLLFIAIGPFSAIPAMFAVITLGQECDAKKPEKA